MPIDLLVLGAVLEAVGEDVARGYEGALSPRGGGDSFAIGLDDVSSYDEPAETEVERRLSDAVRRNAKELLVLTGEAPDEHPEVRAKLRSLGHEDFVAYDVRVC